MVRMDDQRYDCIIVGAGPAGLSASLFLSRYRLKTLTFHHSSPRNLYSHGIHGFLGHHGILPSELLDRGRQEVTAHGGSIMEARVIRIERARSDCFRVITGGDGRLEHSFFSRRLLLATGLRDNTPTCDGFHEFYGRSVHHCADCDGFEHRDQHIAVLGHGKQLVGFVLNLLTWTNRLTILTDGHAEGVPAENREQLKRFNITAREDKVRGLAGDRAQGHLQQVQFYNGEPLFCSALFFTLGSEPASDLHQQLGCREDENGLVRVDQTQHTSIEGVYAAGDLTPHSQLAVVAAAEGAMAAIHIHKSLLPDDRRP